MVHTPHQSPDDKQLFRFSVISQVLSRIARGERRPDAVLEVASSPHADGSGRVRRVSQRSIYRWLALYETRGIQGLADAPRKRTRDRIEPRLLAFLLAELKKDPEASVPELIRRARVRAIVPAAVRLHRSTIHRALLRHGVSLVRARKRRDRDSRRFTYPHRMDMVLCDGKHFRAGAARLRRVALSFLDDATRNILHIVVGPSESAELFLRGLHECILKHGTMTALYLDHGPGFIANATRIVTANLDIHLVLGAVAYPQGHGKVERYHRTLEADLIRFLDRRPEIDPAISALTLRLRHYVHEVYAHQPHQGLFEETPHRRFFELDERPLRLITEPDAFEQAFEIQHVRRVSHDHVVSLDGVLYEMPRGTGARRVTLHQRMLDRQVLYEHQGRRIRLHPVDPEKNARAQRSRPAAKDPQDAPQCSGSAAELRFQEDFPPLVDEHGGCAPDLEDPRDPYHDDCSIPDDIPF